MRQQKIIDTQIRREKYVFLFPRTVGQIKYVYIYSKGFPRRVNRSSLSVDLPDRAEGINYIKRTLGSDIVSGYPEWRRRGKTIQHVVWP